MDVLLDILNEMVKAHPTSNFVNSLHQQYCNRGGLSKKQLEGLHSKASKTANISQGRLATLEAIIKKTNQGTGCSNNHRTPSCKR
ncbi:MAG: hypothetical protein IPI88_08820 [Chitinophagaceae bacterium]|nr:hypothetical protein [Chitinophagaceae bacterium]